MHKTNSVKWGDRIISAASYLSAGWAGMIILVLMYFIKKTPSRFLQFNVFQSIFISLLFFVLAMSLNIISKLLSFIPLVNTLVAQISFLLNKPLFGDYSLLQAFLAAIMIYTCTFSILGKYPKLLGISKIIDYAVR